MLDDDIMSTPSLSLLMCKCLHFWFVNSVTMTSLQVNKGKARSLDGKVCRDPLVDLIVYDCPENLPVPLISEDKVPSWNSDPTFEGIQNVFQFAEENLQDNGCLLVFHSYSLESRRMFAGLKNIFKKLDMKKEWLAFNQLDLASGVKPGQVVSS